MANKKKEPILTPEEKREKDLQNFLSDRTELLPKPTYFFNIGDRVTIGNLQDVYVCDVINDGLVYEIDYSHTSNNYGNPIKYEHCKMFVKWLDIRPYHFEDIPSLIKNTDLRLSYSQMQMGELFGKAYYFGTNFDPEYQRDYVWELQDKVDLIDSIFNNIDIGKFVFIHKDYGENYLYEILDGKQRMRAILDYYENRFAYKGKYFNDLNERDQDHFEGYATSIAEVRDISREQAMRYFVMVNKHGKVMDKAQIEKVEKMIEDINQ
jgi:hypothetical protein